MTTVMQVLNQPMMSVAMAGDGMVRNRNMRMKDTFALRIDGI